jgi:hypothetical protein
MTILPVYKIDLPSFAGASVCDDRNTFAVVCFIDILS